MSTKHLAFLSMPMEALLDILSGRATATLPNEIPADSVFLYSFIEPEHQILKICLTHDKFDAVTQAGFIKTYQMKIMLNPEPESPKVERYEAETLIGTEQWHRDV